MKMEFTKRRWYILIMLLLAACALVPAAPALADGGPPDPGNEGTVIWNEDYTLEEGEELEGDLIVFNGDVTLEEDSQVEGAVIVWNGSATIDGSITGDLVVSIGDIHLGPTASVDGQVVCTWNCDVKQDEGAQVGGGVFEANPWEAFRFDYERGTPIPVPSPISFWASAPGQALGWILKLVRTVAAILVVAAVAGLVALIWPQPTAQIGHTVIKAPWQSLGIGFLAVVAATVLVVVLAITICLSPIALLAALALGAAGLFGWIGVGAVVGERVLQALKAREIEPMWAAALGTLVVTAISSGLSIAFCLAPLGWLATLIVGCMGLGAVALTRFGTTAYTPTTGSAVPPTSPPLPPAPPELTPAEEVEEAEPVESPEDEGESSAE
jgi:hypothetical protein